ncbi:sugar ABC transporter substrate-binding protein [Streptomyces sulfonofaciens]|uniref:sugar ABC transporter substrate-binding protein n=1 Tax=Streptomyces sulfonofaciens TaxID=68272 RepID=UPI001E5FC64F|nr:substrate-binding domain-containing protein [Streptomyces sulfonofaciens]
MCALTLCAAACGHLPGSGDDDPHRKVAGDAVKVGLLLPEKETARYERFDRPVVEEQVKKLTHGKGTVVYANADSSAGKQKAQMDDMIDDNVDTILVDAVDAKAIGPAVGRAKAAGINVIAYDRLAEGPVDGYITFDGELVGQVQGRALMEALGKHADKSSRIVMMNGSPTDPNAALFKKGALAELQDVTIAKSYDTVDWKPENARANMAAAIKSIGARNIAGVYSANDGMAGGIVTALKDAGVTQLPPITGQDAELPAVQRVVAGEQYMTVYKPYRQEAAVAAEMAVKISQGRLIEFDALAMDRAKNASTRDIPSHLVPVRPVMQRTIASTVVKDGIYTVKDICTPAYEAACRTIGLEK